MTLTDLTPDHAGAAHDAAYRLGKRHGTAAWRDGYRADIDEAVQFYERKAELAPLTQYERGMLDALKAKTQGEQA